MKRLPWVLILALLPFAGFSQTVLNVTDYGADRHGGADTVPAVTAVLNAVRGMGNVPVRIVFPKGVYRFFPEQAEKKEYYISNHDQENPKTVGMVLEEFRNLTIDGNDSLFLFHGRMLPVSVVGCRNIILKNFSIDFDDPKIAQVTLVDKKEGLFRVSDETDYRIENGRFVFFGDGWRVVPRSFMVFHPQTGRVLPQTGDSYAPSLVSVPAEAACDGLIRMRWAAARYPEGTVLTLRDGQRPTPGIFVHLSRDAVLQNISVHFAEGMGLLAQMTENIRLDGFRVCLAEKSSRYFTTQADATHFSGCKGVVISENGLYENMMDDAINVHGTYLKVERREGDRTVIASYRHPQTYGFEWGFPGESVAFVNPLTMETVGDIGMIEHIEAIGTSSVAGSREFRITFTAPLDRRVQRNTALENREWTSEVIFRNNTIRNNRARGALFNTPKSVLVENNFFDHTSGTAVLLCGDANGWFESGACRDVVIRNNRFVNALTSLYQFTEAVISIYPEIPFPGLSRNCFHSGIVIENNFFDTFDRPLLYAKSVDGIRFCGNEVFGNTDFRPFHPNRRALLFDRCRNIVVEGNRFDDTYGFSPEKDIRLKRTSQREVLTDAVSGCSGV